MPKRWPNQEAVVREYPARASSEWNIPGEENVSRTLSCTFRGSYRVHERQRHKTIREEQDIGVSSRCDRERAEEIDIDATPGLLGWGIKVIGQRTVSREFFCA